jgi:hypothetical protein
MFKDSIQARREIAQNFAELNYQISPGHWQTLCMGINRDLQAKKLRPNVSVPSRKAVLPFLRSMYKETGSMLKAILAFGFDGPWTSSGGSFRLAREIGFDIAMYSRNVHHKYGSLTFLEIGAAWAGFHDKGDVYPDAAISGLATTFREHLGESVHLHFTNLTPWHEALPTGVVEHPYVTAAGLGLLEARDLVQVKWMLSIPRLQPILRKIFRHLSKVQHGFSKAVGYWFSTMTRLLLQKWTRLRGIAGYAWSDVNKWAG